MTLDDAATLSGYQICRSVPDGVEITGEGNWERLVHRCKEIVRRSRIKFVLVILRTGAERTGYQIGTGDIIADVLPSVGKRWAYPAPLSGYHGVRRSPTNVKDAPVRWMAEIRGRKDHVYVYLGTYDTPLEAARVRESYVLRHHRKNVLNFPDMAVAA